MMRAAVMVGEISATAWASSSVKERQFAFSCGEDTVARSFERVHPLAPLVPFASQVRCAAIAITLCSHWSSQNLQFVNGRWSSMLRPWDFKIVIRRDSKPAVFLQIAHALADEIKRGRLAPGTALPGSRELAESLDINRKTVIQAYAELEAQGWVTSEKTRGTFVSAHLPEIAQKTKEPRRGRIPERPDFRM